MSSARDHECELDAVGVCEGCERVVDSFLRARDCICGPWRGDPGWSCAGCRPESTHRDQGGGVEAAVAELRQFGLKSGGRIGTVIRTLLAELDRLRAEVTRERERGDRQRDLRHSAEELSYARGERIADLEAENERLRESHHNAVAAGARAVELAVTDTKRIRTLEAALRQACERGRERCDSAGCAPPYRCHHYDDLDRALSEGTRPSGLGADGEVG